MRTGESLAPGWPWGTSLGKWLTRRLLSAVTAWREGRTDGSVRLLGCRWQVAGTPRTPGMRRGFIQRRKWQMRRSCEKETGGAAANFPLYSDVERDFLSAELLQLHFWLLLSSNFFFFFFCSQVGRMNSSALTWQITAADKKKSLYLYFEPSRWQLQIGSASGKQLELKPQPQTAETEAHIQGFFIFNRPSVFASSFSEDPLPVSIN